LNPPGLGAPVHVDRFTSDATHKCREAFLWFLYKVVFGIKIC
jgi:hypothetical protein